MTDQTVSDQALTKVYRALEQAHQANEIDINSIGEAEFLRVAKRAFVPETKEPTRQLALVVDATGERFIRVTDDADEVAPWAAQDEGYFHEWANLVQPVLVITKGVSAKTLARWQAKALKAVGDAEALAKFESGEGFVEDTSRRRAANVPFVSRSGGRDL